MLVGERDHALETAGELGGLFKPAFAGGVEGRIDSVGDLADVGEQAVAVASGRGSEFSDERLVSRADGSYDVEPLLDRQLCGDDPPGVSNPRTAGSGSGKTPLRSPRRIFRSVGPTPDEWTLIRSCVSDGDHRADARRSNPEFLTPDRPRGET
jgi:hypothetical protein